MIKLLYFLLGCLPLKFRVYTGIICGKLFSLLPGREKLIALTQLKICFSEEESNLFLPQVFSNAGQTIMECLNLKPYTDNIDQYVSCQNWELAEKYRKNAKSIVVLTAHTSNWDLLAAYAINKGFKVATIARQARKKSLQRLLELIRGSYGIQTIWKENKDSTRQILKCLKSNSVLAALIDQDLQSEGIHIPFFSIPAKYPDSLIKLAKKNGSAIIVAFIFRESRFRYNIFLHEIDSNLNSTEILTEYSRLLENYIKKYPAQWVWFHKRWRSTADEKRLSGQEYLKYLNEYAKNSNKSPKAA